MGIVSFFEPNVQLSRSSCDGRLCVKMGACDRTHKWTAHELLLSCLLGASHNVIDIIVIAHCSQFVIRRTVITSKATKDSAANPTYIFRLILLVFFTLTPL